VLAGTGGVLPRIVLAARSSRHHRGPGVKVIQAYRYMLNSPIGTKSTFWEGFTADGSFDYGGTYMSAAHG
jgi:hypothetical protein